MKQKVDVIINVYGKPYQTLCTLKSLMDCSGQHVDKIYMIIENEQPANTNFDLVFENFNNLYIYQPSVFYFINRGENVLLDYERLSVRYQYGIEKSDKNFVFITHNDVLYTSDIIGNMLNEIGDCVGIGEIGQCWNCPAKSANLCSGEKFYEWNPTYNEVMSLPLPHIRTFPNMIDTVNPKPMPECRLNEWACMLNREIVVKEGFPFFGIYSVDLGTVWFRDMHLKGYKFKDYRKDYIHKYWADDWGYQVQLNENKYQQAELKAKEYYEATYKSLS